MTFKRTTVPMSYVTLENILWGQLTLMVPNIKLQKMLESSGPYVMCIIWAHISSHFFDIGANGILNVC